MAFTTNESDKRFQPVAPEKKRAGDGSIFLALIASALVGAAGYAALNTRGGENTSGTRSAEVTAPVGQTSEVPRDQGQASLRNSYDPRHEYTNSRGEYIKCPPNDGSYLPGQTETYYNGSSGLTCPY